MNEQAQDRSVVLAVVMLLGLVATVGLAGGIFLIYEKAEPSSVALVFAIPTAAVGALAGILASTRSAPTPTVQAAQAQGYVQAVSDVKEMAAPDSPQPVQVVNALDEAIPVKEAGDKK